MLVQSSKAPEKASCMVIPDVPAGSVVLFTEAVMHGTAHGEPTTSAGLCSLQALRLPPPAVPLTPRQQALLTEPAAHLRSFRPSSATEPARSGRRGSRRRAA